MRPIRYRMRSSLRTHRARSVALAAIVAIVGGLVLTLAAGVLRTSSAPERYEARLGSVFDVSLEQDHGRPRTAEIAALPAVAAVETATFVFGGLVAPGEEKPIEALAFAGSHLAFGDQLADGREPQRSTPGEFLATRSWVSLAQAQLGDQFQLLTITQEQADERGFDVAEPEGPTITATLVGVIEGPAELQDDFRVAVFPAELLDVGDVAVSATVGLVSLESGATIEDLRTELDALPGGGVFGLDTAELVSGEVRSAVRTQGQGLGVVAAIVAVGAIIVVGQLLSRQVRLPPADRLAMSSVGLTRSQIVADPLCFAAPPIIAGSLGAGVLAIVASGVFPVGFVQRIEPSPGLRFEPLVHGFGSLLLALLLLLCALLTLMLGDRDRRDDHRPGMAEELLSRLRPGPAALGMRFTLTRHPRDPGSARAPVIGLVLVLGVLVGALTFGASLGRFIDEPARYGSNFDLGIGAGGDQVPEEVRHLLEQDPDVADVAFFGTILASVGATSLDITGMEPVRGEILPDLLAGRPPGEDDEIVLGRVAARRLGVDVGDELVVSGGAAPVTYLVTGLAVIPGIEGGDGIGEGGVVTLPGLRRLDPAATLGTAALRLRPGAEGAAERLAAATGTNVGPYGAPPTITNLARVRSTPFIVAIALGALAVLSMAHQLILSARRRRHDLAVLRALGADRRWMTSILHWQATVLAAVVTVLAIPLGVALGRIVYATYIERIGARADVSMPFALLGLILVTFVVLGNLAALAPARRARHELPGRVLIEE